MTVVAAFLGFNASVNFRSILLLNLAAMMSYLAARLRLQRRRGCLIVLEATLGSQRSWPLLRFRSSSSATVSGHCSGARSLNTYVYTTTLSLCV